MAMSVLYNGSRRGSMDVTGFSPRTRSMDYSTNMSAIPTTSMLCDLTAISKSLSSTYAAPNQKGPSTEPMAITEGNSSKDPLGTVMPESPRDNPIRYLLCPLLAQLPMKSSPKFWTVLLWKRVSHCVSRGFIASVHVAVGHDQCHVCVCVW